MLTFAGQAATAAAVGSRCVMVFASSPIRQSLKC